MPNLKEVRNRIQSIKSTRQITSAMKMVSASKLHKSQQAVVSLRLYANHLQAFLTGVQKQIPAARKNPLTIDRGTNHVLLISISSNKGLCGAYNASLIKRTLQHVHYLNNKHIETKLFLIGKKNEQYFQNKKYEIFRTDNGIVDKLSFNTARELARLITGEYLLGTFDRIEVVYNRFVNAVMQELVIEQLLPVPLSDLGIQDAKAGIEGPEIVARYEENEQQDELVGYILEPDPDDVTSTLIPEYVACNLYRILLDAAASEHGARMTAMHKATDNADELVGNLTLTYNKVRQAMITREIMEIVRGAEN